MRAGMIDGRVVIIEALIGSHNYNLNTPASDEDIKYFVAPTFDDLYRGKFYAHAQQSETLDMDTHDIRKLGDLLYKSNICYLEVLHSKRVTIRPEVELLFDNPEYFTTGNLPAFWSATFGMHCEKMAALHKGTAKTDILVEKFGYDTKQACHALRCLYVLEKYADRGSMTEALWFDKFEPMRQMLLDVKAGLYTEDSFRAMVSKWISEKREGLEKYYKSHTPNLNVKKDLEDITYNIVKKMMV